MALSDRVHPMATNVTAKNSSSGSIYLTTASSQSPNWNDSASLPAPSAMAFAWSATYARVDVLFELFPWVRAEFLAGVQSHETAGEKALKEQMKRLEKLMLQQDHTPIQLPASTGPKAIYVPKFDTPNFDDDDIVLKKDTSTEIDTLPSSQPRIT